MTSLGDMPQEIIDKIYNYVFYMKERDKIIEIKKGYNKMITTTNSGWMHDGVSWIGRPGCRTYYEWLEHIGFFERSHSIHAHPPRRSIYWTEEKKRGVRYFNTITQNYYVWD